MKALAAFALLITRAAGHGWVFTPVSKNEMQYNHYQSGMPDSLRWEPQTCYWGNQAGAMLSGAGYSCGAKQEADAKGLATWQKWYDSAGVAPLHIKAGDEIPVSIKITADHGGQSWLTIACDDHIGEDVNWTYLERAKSDRDHHFMPSNPGIYAWATTEASSRMNSIIKATWVVPDDFTCSTGKVVGRWLWKTGSTCTDENNIGRPTQKFNVSEWAAVVHAFTGDHGWVKEPCKDPPETFISCLDFTTGDVPPPPPPSPPGPPTPPPAPPTPKTPTCCWSNWGSDDKCGQYTGPGGKCNTNGKKCSGDNDCAPGVSHPCPLMAPEPKCCYSKWGDDSTCGNYTGPGAQCNSDHSKSCNTDGDCPALGPQPSPPSPPSPPLPPPSPPGPAPGPDAVNACHDAAKAYCTNKGGYCRACQAWGEWGNMFFTAVCNDDSTVCHQPIVASNGVTCSCQQAGGCSAGGATCAGPSEDIVV